MTLRYPVKLEADDNGTVLATCPSLPEVTTFGEDDADALANAVGAIEKALAARIADGEDIPPPPARPRGRLVALPLMTSLKASLYRTLRESGITRAELMRINCPSTCRCAACREKLQLIIIRVERGS
jgi:antitoxin HicB